MWFELYILAASCAENPAAILHSAIATAAKHASTQLRQFAKEATSLVQLMCTPESQHCFRATGAGTNRGLMYGYSNRLQHIQVAPLLRDIVADNLDIVMLHLKRSLSKSQR